MTGARKGVRNLFCDNAEPIKKRFLTPFRIRMNDECRNTNEAATGVLEAPEVVSRSLESHPIRQNSTVFWVLVVSIAALFLTLAWPMLRGEIYLADDLGDFHLPMRAFYAQQLAHSEPFDWCPDLYCGFYVTGEGQAGGYHPLHWVLYRTLPLSLAFDLECWLSYPLMLIGLYAFFRRLRLSDESALFGSIAFTFGGFNLLHFVHPNAIAVIAHLPWLLCAIDIGLRSQNAKYRCWAWASIGALTGSQLLLGYPQYVLYSAFVEFGYLLLVGWNMPARSRAVIRGIACWTAALLLGALLAGVQLLPTFDLLQHSVRQNIDHPLATQGSLHPFNLLQLVAPYLLDNRVVGENTHELGLYLGAAPLALAVWHLANRRNRRRFRAVTAAAIITALFGLLWCFGSFGPLGWLQEHTPLVNKFRLPCRAIVVFQLGMATLAALGFGDLVSRQSAQFAAAKTTQIHRLWLLPIVALALAIAVPIVWPAHVSAWPLVIVGPVLILFATCLIQLALNGVRWALPLLVIFAAADLAVYGMSESIWRRTEPLANFIKQIDVPPADPQCRVAVDLACGRESAPGENGLRVGDRILFTGWKRADGYAGLEPARRLDYGQPAALQVAGVGWISDRAAAAISTELQPKMTAAEKAPEHWIPLPNPSPRVRLVSATFFSNDPAHDLCKIAENQAIVDEPLELPAGPVGRAILIVDRPGHIVVELNCPTQQLLIVNESFYPGWTTTIDGHDAKLLRVNGDFLGVVTPPGHHEICLEFQPDSLRIGRLVSCFGLGLLVVTFVLGATFFRSARV
jgi:Bacterial membrane protein YfhO